MLKVDVQARYPQDSRMRSISRLKILVAGVVLGAVVAGGVAWAVTTIAPTPTDRFYACVSPQGLVRASAIKLNVAPTKCPSATDTIRSWSAGQIDSVAQQCGAFPHPGVNWYVPGSAPKNGCNMAGANLTGANFHQADLRNVVLAGATLNGADLSGADLRGADFANSKLEAANLSGANLDGVDLSTSTLAVVASGGIIGTPTLPAGWINSNGVLIGPRADLSGIDLSNVNLGTLDLSEARLDGVKSGNTSGNPRLPQDWTLTTGLLIGPGADLTAREMSGFNLSGRNLYGTNLTETNLTNANLSGARLGDARLVGANLTNANLDSSNLAGARLTGATVSGSQFNRAEFYGVITGGLVGTPQAPTFGPQRTVANGYLVTQYANLRGADLSNLDLRGGDLRNVDATGANLSGALTGSLEYGIFRGANLSNMNMSYRYLMHADFTGADMSGVNFYLAVWSSTICPDGFVTSPQGSDNCLAHLAI